MNEHRIGTRQEWQAARAELLEDAGVVSRVIDGRTHHLALRPEALATTAEWIESQRSRWEGLFDVVGDYLDEEKQRR